MIEGAQSLPALLIVGPTGSGKTPLGDWLQAHGLWGRLCHHFDFGANLRGIAAGTIAAGMTDGERQFIRDVLEKGALLENETFHLALKILQAFLDRRQPWEGDLILLNGLPRHVGQAADVDRVLDVRVVVHLDCDAATVHERVRRDSGGDRAGRVDDSLELVNQKLATFTARTMPMLEHYRQHGAHVIRIPVGIDTRPTDVERELEQWRTESEAIPLRSGTPSRSAGASRAD